MKNKEKTTEAQGVEVVARKQAPSKTGVLTSIKTLRKNLELLDWMAYDSAIKELEGYVKNKIIDEL